MQRNITPFFATQNDIAEVLLEVAAVRPIKIVKGGLFDSPTLQICDLSEKWDPSISYLIADEGAIVEVREVPQRKGLPKYAVDQLVNPSTVALRAGGLVGHQCLLAGQIGTTTRDEISTEIYKVSAASIRKRFAKIQSYYVGKEALTLFEEGWRLTANPKAPAKYDLSRSL